MAIEQRADNAPVEDSGKSLLMALRLPFRDHFIAVDETANV